MDISQEEIKERIEHRDAILNIRAVLATRPGKEFFKYLFKALDVGELPTLGTEGIYLAERLGFLRAGNSIFKLTAEANFELAGHLLAEIEKDRYDELYKETKNA